MKTQNCLSPTKQNLSPTRQAIKSGDPISELIGYIKAAGLKIPSHVEKAIMGQQATSFLKIIPTESSKDAQITKKLKVKLGDTEFELKKIQQDFAQYKLNSRLDKQKEIKKWEEAYNLLKSSSQCSNEDFSSKLLKLREKSQKQIVQLKEKHKLDLKYCQQKITKAYEQKILVANKLSKRQLSQTKQKHKQQINQLTQKHINQFKNLRQVHQNQLKKQGIKYKQVLDNKQKQYEGACLALQSQKKTQQKLHEKTRIQASQIKQKLYTELYYEKNMRKHLEETLEKKQIQIKQLKSKIHDLEISMILEKQRSLKKQKEIKQQLEVQKQGILQLNKQNVSCILLNHQKELKKYESSIQRMKQWKQHRQALLKEQYDEIQAKFDERPSRQEDLDTIQKLKVKIMRKQQEIRMLNKELKNCVLESENKEETYNRIFTLSKMDKKTLSKDKEQYKSRESLCRKSQTTDIKFLLKVYNKHL